MPNGRRDIQTCDSRMAFRVFQTILLSLIPVAFVALLGYMAARGKFLQATERALITKLVMTWLLPPLLLAGILRTPRADLLDYKIPLIFLVGLMAPYLVVLLGCRFVLRYDQRTAALKASLVAFPDMVFMGIPVLGQLFGPSSLFPILIANLVPTLIIVPLTTVLLDLGSASGKNGGNQVFLKIMVRAVREPRVWAPFIGAVLVILNVRIPEVAINSLNLIGDATTGLSLFVVGLIIAEEKVRVTAAVVGDVVFKSLLQPAAMLATVYAFGVTGTLAREAVLLTAIPSAVITTMFAQEYGILTSESSTTILATRVLSLVTIPIVYVLTRNS